MCCRDRFVQNLRCWRRIRGLTQEQLSERLGMSVAYIGSMETRGGFPSPETLDDICTVLNIDITDLLCEPIFNSRLAKESVAQSKQDEWIKLLNMSFKGGMK